MMTDNLFKINEKKRDSTYDTLFKRAIAGDKEALASLNILIQNTEHVKKYSLLEDIRQTAYEEYLDKGTPKSAKEKILLFFNKLIGR